MSPSKSGEKSTKRSDKTAVLQGALSERVRETAYFITEKRGHYGKD
jgi:hypothetical protein